ncbi:MAG: amidohydrolase family protein [Xanthobacteraceae bacterium]
MLGLRSDLPGWHTVRRRAGSKSGPERVARIGCQVEANRRRPPRSDGRPRQISHVSVKLSGTPTVRPEPYPFGDMKAHLKRCFDAFGPQRCYWGTDMTNSFAKTTYKQRITHFTEELDFLSEADKDWVMGRAILERIWNT